MGRLNHKTALITGGTTGIGLATARLFQQEGARVAITGQDEGRVAQAAALLGPTALALRADVASRTEMEAVARRLQDEFGGLDVLFANAGIAQPRPIAEVDADHLDRLIDVNFKGVVHSVQTMLPLLRNPASVVLNATTMIERGIAGMSIYSATKAAVRSLARSLSAELVHRGVRVNAVSPGLVETPIYGKLGLPPEAVKAWAEQLLAGVPAQRFGRDDEIAKAVLFLASDDSSYVLGENLLVDGGVATV
ncbi:SDR family oxidoreductase [Schlegelella sp. S2-27]|uniref:SDR family oxidoreductase n=1 Tax=Caldimonas mangrovi TaxID=2944811 RepID=A0ABT0YLL6_9BURK|nr:SDR family oxidoreductase [Caldimonas mangrovi]MCM5679625.1 SDR family oxidoreductase [Caldimonas mangrovi]